MSLWDKKSRPTQIEALESEDVLATLSTLVEKSLVTRDDATGRYRLLETVRQYGIERLVETDQADAIRHRHLDYFLSFAEGAEPELRGANQGERLHQLETEYDNLRAAMEWSADDPVSEEIGLRLTGALWVFWETRGHLTEGRLYLDTALERPCVVVRKKERAKALNGAGMLAHRQGDFPAALAFHEESLAIRRELCDQAGIASSLNNLAIGVLEQGDFAAAHALHEESLAIARVVGDRYGIATLLGNLGNCAYLEGNYVAAQALQEESLAIRRELGDKRGAGHSLADLGDLAYRHGDYAAACALYREGLTIQSELGDRRGSLLSLEGLAAATSAGGFEERAARMWGAAEALREVIGMPLPPHERPRLDRQVAQARSASSDESFSSAWQEGRTMTLEQAIDYALEDQL